MLKTIILAAGAGTRMKSKIPKVLHKILGKTLIDYVIGAAKEASSEEICIVVGHKGEEVVATLEEGIQYVWQKEQLGTGHAVMQGEEFIGDDGNVLVLFGDVPLIKSSTLRDMVKFHEANDNGVTVLSTVVDNPKGYGRIIRDDNNCFVKSVEDKDASEEEKRVNEINSGLYCFKARELNWALKRINNNNAQGEYYLPDALVYIMEKGLKVDAMILEDQEEVLGINTRVQLSDLSKIMQNRINTYHMLNGVTLINPDNTYIGKDVSILEDTIIYPNTFLEGSCMIGRDVVVGPNTKIVNSQIDDGTVIDQSVVLNSQIGKETSIGPFAYIRPGCEIGEHVKIGDFVEVKNSKIGHNTKASHLTYIGDADVGERINFGCGTVVVNYDGVKKHRTIIGDDAFIGCNTNLISPVKIDEKAYTAAGSTITKDVPPYALGIGRAKQINIEEWVKRKR